VAALPTTPLDGSDARTAAPLRSSPAAALSVLHVPE
jgi:hypothetical protein